MIGDSKHAAPGRARPGGSSPRTSRVGKQEFFPNCAVRKVKTSGSNSNSQRHMMRPVVSLAVAATLLAGALAQDLCTNLNIGTTSGDDDVMSFGVVRTPCLLLRASRPTSPCLA
jgi:hypothetical protein